MTRFFYDCEFVDNGVTIDLISIGIVSSNDSELYLQCSGFNARKANQWVVEHVFPSLVMCPRVKSHKWRGAISDMVSELRAHKSGQCIDWQRGWIHECPWRTHEQIRDEVRRWFINADDGSIELWGFYSAYDHVALAQLFGAMIDLPQGWPMLTYDLKQWADQLGCTTLPEQGKGEHNALADAKHNLVMWEYLDEYHEGTKTFPGDLLLDRPLNPKLRMTVQKGIEKPSEEQ